MESKTRQIQVSKKLSYFLRHHLDMIPESESIDPAGYVPISSLLKMKDFISAKITQEEILEAVEKSDKKRFGLDSTGTKIRANQGHSLKSGTLIDQNLLLTRLTAPLDYCAHGTTRQAIKQILETGLKSMNRTHIHFASKPNAISGFRSNSTVLVHVDMSAAMRDGIEFYISENEVILSPGPIDPQYFKSIDYL